MSDCVTCISHWENTASLSYADLSNADTFYYTIFQKNHFINIIPEFIRKSSKFWKGLKVLGCGSGYKFSQILIFASKFKFYHCQQGLSVVFLENSRGHGTRRHEVSLPGPWQTHIAHGPHAGTRLIRALLCVLGVFFLTCPHKWVPSVSLWGMCVVLGTQRRTGSVTGDTEPLLWW